MKRISTYIATLVLALAGSSCSDYLDKEYDASLSEKKVFNNQNLTREFLANIYTNLPDGLAPLSDDQFTGASRDCMTDNAVTCWGLHYYTKIGSDGYTAGDHPLLGFWNTDLYGIRKCIRSRKYGEGRRRQPPLRPLLRRSQTASRYLPFRLNLLVRRCPCHCGR